MCGAGKESLGSPDVLVSLASSTQLHHDVGSTLCSLPSLFYTLQHLTQERQIHIIHGKLVYFQ